MGDRLRVFALELTFAVERRALLRVELRVGREVLGWINAFRSMSLRILISSCFKDWERLSRSGL